RGLVETGALVEGAAGWETVADALAEASASRRAAAFLARRLQLLGPDTLALLEAAAIIGKEFDADLAADLTPLSIDQVHGALNEARRRHLVWVRGSRCSFVHDKVRESVLDRIGTEERRDLHRQAADRIEAIGADRVF